MFNMALQPIKTMTVNVAIQNIVQYVGDVVDAAFVQLWNYIQSFFPRDEPNMFKEGDLTVGNKISYTQIVKRQTNKPYTFTHKLRDKDKYITAISCLPIKESPGLPCPETNVLDGGINDNYVKICLEPACQGTWGCDIKIYSNEE